MADDVLQQLGQIVEICQEHGRLDVNGDGEMAKLIGAEDMMATEIEWLTWCRDCGHEFTFKATPAQMKRLVINDIVVQDVFPAMEPWLRDVVRPRGVFCPECQPILCRRD